MNLWHRARYVERCFLDSLLLNGWFTKFCRDGIKFWDEKYYLVRIHTGGQEYQQISCITLMSLLIACILVREFEPEFLHPG